MSFGRPIAVQCADGVTRRIVMPVALHVGDWPEQCNNAGLMSATNCQTPCNICETPGVCQYMLTCVDIIQVMLTCVDIVFQTELFSGDAVERFPLRGKQRTAYFRNKITTLRASGRHVAAKRILKELSMVENCMLWADGHKYFCAHQCCPPDPLHQADAGIIKCHLQWFILLVQHKFPGRSGNKKIQEFDRLTHA